MEALQYVRSVPRYLATRWLGQRWDGFATSPWACLRLADVPPPTLPGPRWARLQPALSGICGSDLATITAQGTPYFSPFTSTPFVFGHEVVGRVLDVGAAVTRVRPGDRVVLAPPLHCAVRGIDPLCGPCRAGTIGHCRNITRGDLAAGIQTGYCRDTGGGWSRELVAHELQLHAVPEALPDEEAVLIEPFSCCLHAVEGAALRDDAVALVLGCGTIGALTIAAVRATGSRCRLIAVARYPHQQRAARALGADVVVGTGAGLRAELAALLGAELFQPELGPPVALGGADVCFDCIGSGGTLDDALRFTRELGTVIVVGMPGRAEGVDWTAMWHKALDVRGSYTCDDPTFVRAVALVAATPGRLAGIVGATFPLADYRAALASALDTGASGVLKTAFRP